MSKRINLANMAVIKKIKKCLSLAQSANKHESDLALLHAQKLAIHHNLEISEINDVDTSSVDKEIQVEDRKELSPATKYVVTLVEEYFNVKMLHYKNQPKVVFVFVGWKTDIITAKMIYNHLIKEFETRWKEAQEQRNRNRKTGMTLHSDVTDILTSEFNQTDFFYGMWSALDEKLKRNRAKSVTKENIDKYALIVSDVKKEINDFLATWGVNDVDKKDEAKEYQSCEAVASGYFAGMQVDVESKKNLGYSG